MIRTSEGPAAWGGVCRPFPRADGCGGNTAVRPNAGLGHICGIPVCARPPAKPWDLHFVLRVIFRLDRAAGRHPIFLLRFPADCVKILL